jgi:hypothetical protein
MAKNFFKQSLSRAKSMASCLMTFSHRMSPFPAGTAGPHLSQYSATKHALKAFLERSTKISPYSRTLEYYSIPSSRPAKISTMRILLNIHIPHEPFNASVRDGTAGQKLGRIVDEIKPEAVYFTEQHGQRGAVMIVEMSDPSKIPTLAEPWFLTFNANVEFRVVMTPDDLKKAGLDEIGKKWA